VLTGQLERGVDRYEHEGVVLRWQGPDTGGIEGVAVGEAGRLHHPGVS